MNVCWVNGELLKTGEAGVSLLDHGVLYGDGIFEGIRFYHGRAFMLAAHLRRLFQSAAATGLSIPYRAEQLSAAIDTCIAAFGAEDGYIRLVVTRGDGGLGIDPGSCPRPTVFIVAADPQVIDATSRGRGLSLNIVATRKVPNSCWDARIKSLNYLNNILARMEARRYGADDALMLNQRGHITESSVSNLFIVRDGVLYTPPLHDGVLEGVTRGLMLAFAARLGIRAEQVSLLPYDLYFADECFLTGTAIELIPVREIDGHPLPGCPGPVFKRLLQAFQECIAAGAASADGTDDGDAQAMEMAG